MSELLTLAEVQKEVIVIVAIAGGLSVAVISIVISAFQSMFESRLREQSRREIAAYIAEGSMSPDEGERLLNAGGKPKRPSKF